MIDKMVELFRNIHIDAMNQFADRLGFASITSSLGLTMAKGSIPVPWGLTDYALLISCVGGILFIIEKILVIYLRYKESKELAKTEKQKRKSRKIP